MAVPGLLCPLHPPDFPVCLRWTFRQSSWNAFPSSEHVGASALSLRSAAVWNAPRGHSAPFHPPLLPIPLPCVGGARRQVRALVLTSCALVTACRPKDFAITPLHAPHPSHPTHPTTRLALFTRAGRRRDAEVPRRQHGFGR
eukprot:350674-Chlamydomonas_euryale.AAC.4